MTCVITKEGGSIMTGGCDGILRRIDINDLRMTMMYSDEDTERKPCPITSIKFSPFTDYCLTSYCQGYVKLWDMDRGTCLRTTEENNQVLALGVSPLLKQFASTSEDAKIHLYDLETGQLIRLFEGSYKANTADGHTSRIFCVKFHPFNENELVTGGWDNTVQVWDVRRPASCRYFTGPHICGDGLDFDKTGVKLLTCSFHLDKNLLIWNYERGELLVDMTIDNSKVYSAMFFGGSDFVLAACSEPSTLRILDCMKLKAISGYRTSLSGLYAAVCYEPPLRVRRAVTTIPIATVASHYLLKFKFKYKL